MIAQIFITCVSTFCGFNNVNPAIVNNVMGKDSSFIDGNVGSEVSVTMNSGLKYEGELIYVRDSTMIVCRELRATDEELSNNVYPLYFLKNHNIKVIELTGQDGLVLGLVIGSGAAFALGAIGLQIGKNTASEGEGEISNFKEEGIVGCCLGAGIGALVGLLVGAVTTSEDEIVYENIDPEEYDFTKLNAYSRYSSSEPAYLKQIR